MVPSSSTVAPRRSARAAARALLVVLVLSTTTLSGCITDDWLKTRPAPLTSDSAGLVRYFLAAKPGGLPEDFTSYVVTMGPVDVVFDELGREKETIGQGGKKIDLLVLEREQKASLLTQRYMREGEWAGFEFGVVDAELTRRNVIGNRGGEAVHDLETIQVRVPIPAGKVQQRGMVMAPHGVAPGLVVDVYVEIDVRRSLEAKGRDVFEHRTQIHAASLYIDGAKIGQRYFSEEVARNQANTRPYGGDKSTVGATNIQPPDPRIGMYDAWEEDIYRPTAQRMLPRALGLGVPYLFDGSASRSLMMNKAGEFLPIVEHQWDFGDGTHERGARVWKTFTTGGVFDVELRVRDGLDSYASTWVTVFVPYPAAEAVDRRQEVRTGTLLGGGVETPLGLSKDSYRMVFPEDLSDGVWNHGGYRITVEFDDPLGLAEDDDLTLMRVNATSAYIDRMVVGTSPIVIETAGVPTWRGRVLRDWVLPEIDLDVSLVQGAAVEYTLKVEALYFGNLSRGIDGHGHHIHGAWHILQPYFDHLTAEGALLRPYPDGFDPKDPYG